MQQQRRFATPVLILLLLIAAQAGLAQKGALEIEYTVTLTDPATRQFHITTDIKNIKQAQLALSLPTWTPGWYTVENYGKNLLRFKITDKVGKWLPHRMSRKQTWTVDTRTVDHIRVEYDYRATVLALNQAKIADDYAFFTGIQLFLGVEGHGGRPSTVRFKIPEGWRIATALKETADPLSFTAADYDTLVDAPVQLGRFDVTTFQIDGKPHHFVANPAGSFSKEKTDSFIDMLTRIANVQKAMFDGVLPYDKYVYFYFFSPPESNAGGALEHLNSFVAFAPPGNIATPEMLIGTASHEFYHVWNVKRIRPAEMWPYDYSRENETPLLWVSEGFTTYYGGVAVYRAGLMTEENFLQRTADAASSIESTDARHYISPANASVSTWVGYDSPVAFGISYYTQGQNLAALLDLSIRHDTNGTASLDDLMRALHDEHYKRGRGFTTDDTIRIINRLTKKSYNDFYRRYVFGMEVPDYDTIFGYAGYKIEKAPVQNAHFGFNGRFRGDGFAINSVEPGSPADAAGLQIGDTIVKINGVDTRLAPFSTFAGKAIDLTVNRDGNEIKVPMKVGSREVTGFKLATVADPSPQQLKVREGWLKR